MMNTSINKSYLLLILFSGLLICLNGYLHKDQDICEKPNILLILTDQITAEAMSVLGNEYLSTPAFDKLASTGVLFKNSFETQPLCLP